VKENEDKGQIEVAGGGNPRSPKPDLEAKNVRPYKKKDQEKAKAGDPGGGPHSQRSNEALTPDPGAHVALFEKARGGEKALEKRHSLPSHQHGSSLP